MVLGIYVYIQNVRLAMFQTDALLTLSSIVNSDKSSLASQLYSFLPILRSFASRSSYCSDITPSAQFLVLDSLSISASLASG